MHKSFSIPLGIIVSLLFSVSLVSAKSTLLTPEENAWLKSRNNTIIVYPEKNFPPFSYEEYVGAPVGLSIDYMDLIGEKLGITIEYLQAQPLATILEDIQKGKGDVVTSLAPNDVREAFLLFTPTYTVTDSIVVVRNDYADRTVSTFDDFSGKRVAVGEGYAVTHFIREQYPEVVMVPVPDDEVGLQKVILGEVDAAVTDIAALSFFMSKQVLTSVKVISSIGFEYEMALAVPKDKKILHSILEKGLARIKPIEKAELTKKWMTIPDTQTKSVLALSKGVVTPTVLYIGFIVLLVVIIIYLLVHRHSPIRLIQKRKTIRELEDQLEELEEVNTEIQEELESVKDLEKEIKQKIDRLDSHRNE